jgi:hypothetical protein
MSAVRSELKKLDGARFRCRAKVSRFGTKPAFRGPPIATILLVNIVDADTGDMLADHLWLTVGKWSESLSAGDNIEFNARSSEYIKGYRGNRDIDAAPPSLDWKLSRPTKVSVMAHDLEPVP